MCKPVLSGASCISPQWVSKFSLPENCRVRTLEALLSAGRSLDATGEMDMVAGGAQQARSACGKESIEDAVLLYCSFYQHGNHRS
jgi:hypothetical protein